MTTWYAVLPLAVWAVMAIVMMGAWLLQRRTGDAGIVDVFWTYGVGAAGMVYCGLADGNPSRRMLVAVLVGVWSLRLGTHVLMRVLRMPEDGRYTSLKEQWGPRASSKLAVFYQYQAFGVVLFSIPMFVAAANDKPLGLADGVAIAIWLVAAVGEGVADLQLTRFRRNPAHRGRVCDRGLWRYSRHPNYFFEWLHWWAYVAAAWYLPWGPLSLIGPVAMYYFIVYVTGIPPTERQALKSRGEAYRRYQAETSAFIPWIPNRSRGKGLS